jgi:hypothetical protein
VTTDLDTLLTARYVLIDDHVMPSGQRRPGHPKKLSGAELVCLAVAQVLLGARSERDWIRQCYKAAGAPVPYLPHQPGYHERIKVVAPLICKTATSTSPGHMQIEEVPLPDATGRLVISYNPDAAIRAELVGELDELIVGTDTLTVTKRAELCGRISTMSGLNPFLRVTPSGPLPDRQDQGLGGREPGRQVPAALRRPAAIRRGHRRRLQAAPRSRARLAGHEIRP